MSSAMGSIRQYYFFIRRTRLDLAGLYRRDGPYWYQGGWNPWALVALAAGIAPCLPGFAAAAGLIDSAGSGAEGFWMGLYNYAWFVSFGVSLVSYVVLMKIF